MRGIDLTFALFRAKRNDFLGRNSGCRGLDPSDLGDVPQPGGRRGRVATRDDVAMHQQDIADIEASSREALASVNPGPI
jgi:hypothetical protein